MTNEAEEDYFQSFINNWLILKKQDYFSLTLPINYVLQPIGPCLLALPMECLFLKWPIIA